MRVAVRAPNHLGDGVMARPAIEALAARYPVVVHGPRWAPELYGDFVEVRPIGPLHAEVAVLMAPSLRAAVEARRCGRVVGTPTDRRGLLLTDAVAEGTHQADTYAALARILGVRVAGPPRYPVRGTARSVPPAHIGLNPLARGGVTREWPGFRALADALGNPVFYAGPSEGHRLAAIAGPHPGVVGTSLPDFAATLEHCAVFVSNDSGAAHFARACGVPTVVVHGSTSAARTGPAGSVGLERRLGCHPCYRPTCTRALECLDTPVDTVLKAIRAARASFARPGVACELAASP